MKLKRKSYRIDQGPPYQITTLLAVLGLDYRIGDAQSVHGPLRQAGFWLRCEAQLHFILHDAWRAYRQQIKRLHPDKPGGDAKGCAYLNAVWTRIELLFQRKGYVL